MQFNIISAMEHLILMISKSQHDFHNVMQSTYKAIAQNKDDWKARQG
jgi:hypothetical protein